MYLLDASALVPLISEFGKQLIDKAREVRLLTTDLAIYEAGNSLWKLSTILKTISLEDVAEVMSILGDLTATEIIQPTKFTELNLTHTLKTASEEGITFYDSSYILIAKERATTLVTEDRKLRNAASKYVEIMTYKDFKRKLMLAKPR